MKKKLCILQSGLSHGGTDMFVINLCRGINKEEYEIVVVNPSKIIDTEHAVIVTGTRIVHTSPLNGLYGKIKHLLKLYFLFRKEQFDVFQTNLDLFNGPNLFMAWLARVPLRCCHSHNAQQQRETIRGKTIMIAIYQKIMRWMCWQFSNRRCGCSEKAMNFLYYGRNWRDATYPLIINNGIDIDNFRIPIVKNKKKSELGLSNKYHIITVGRIIPQKNPIFLASVVSDFLLRHDDYDMIWVGSGPLEKDCHEIFALSGLTNRVHFFSKRGDVNEILECSDLFFMPSLFEGLPYALVEAQASGLKCLVSDAIDRAVDCGGCCFMSLQEDVNSWSLKMEEILEGKKVLSIDENKIQEYSVDRMVSQMQEVFNS